MRYRLEYRRPGEPFHRVGSAEGHETVDLACHHLREATKTAAPGSVVRVVDDAGNWVMSIEKGNE